MGALCSKGSRDNFAGQGRTVGSVPPSGGTAPVPSSAGRKLGGGGSSSTTPAPARTAGSGAEEEARRKAAAEAAQKRLEASKPKGKLGAQLEAQQKMSRVETLKDASSQALRERELDANAQQLRHD